LLAHLATLAGIQTRVHVERGSEQNLTEIYLIGNTKALDIEDMQSLPGVERVVRVSEEYRILGRHKTSSALPISTTTACASGRTRCMCSPGCARWTTASMSRS